MPQRRWLVEGVGRRLVASCEGIANAQQVTELNATLASNLYEHCGLMSKPIRWNATPKPQQPKERENERERERELPFSTSRSAPPVGYNARRCGARRLARECCQLNVKNRQTNKQADRKTDTGTGKQRTARKKNKQDNTETSKQDDKQNRQHKPTKQTKANKNRHSKKSRSRHASH